mgnify:CR=1 FL=1
MMPLSGTDIAIVLGTVLAVTVVTAGAGMLLLRLARRRSLGVQISIVTGAVLATLTGSTLAIAAQMYISEHDLTILVWVIAAAAVAGILLAVLLARTLRRSLADLGASLDQVAAGAVVPASAHGSPEVSALSAQLAETSRKLAEAREAIEQLDASRRRFLSWISHDLRTPLTAVQALAEATEDGLITDPTELARQVRAQSDAMSRMIDDIFDLSRLSSGALQLRPSRVPLTELISDAVTDVQQIAAGRGIRIVPAALDGTVIHADPHELTRAIRNLLTNAVHYAPAGSTITVSTLHRVTGSVTIAVDDEGAGVDADELDLMFDAGWRGDPSRTSARADGGAGLGLAIVNSIAQAHGGYASAEHLPDGFRVAITVPAAPDGVPSVTDAAAPSRRVGG